jgi:hypothetical protein
VFCTASFPNFSLFRRGCKRHRQSHLAFAVHWLTAESDEFQEVCEGMCLPTEVAAAGSSSSLSLVAALLASSIAATEGNLATIQSLVG